MTCGKLSCPTSLGYLPPLKLKNFHHKRLNVDNPMDTNYCKMGHLHFFIIIVHVKSALKAITQTAYITKHTSDLAVEQTN